MPDEPTEIDRDAIPQRAPIISYWARKKIEKQLARQNEISERIWEELTAIPEFKAELEKERKELTNPSIEHRREWRQGRLFDLQDRIEDVTAIPPDHPEFKLNRLRFLRRAWYVSKCREDWYNLCLARHQRQRDFSVNLIVPAIAVFVLHYLGLSWITAVLTSAAAAALYALYKIDRAVLEIFLSVSAERIAVEKIAGEEDWGWRAPIQARLHLENLLTGREFAFPPIPFASQRVQEEFDRK